MKNALTSLAFLMSAIVASGCHSKKDDDSTGKVEIPLSSSDLRTVDESLAEGYKNSRILFIAHDNHDSKVSQRVVQRLLSQFGQDEKLKGIVVERHHDTADVFDEALSIGLDAMGGRARDWLAANASDTGKDARKGRLSIYNSMCMTPEWMYTLDAVAKDIQSLNVTRENPLKILPIDGISRYKKIFWPQRNLNYHEYSSTDGGCEKFTSGSYITSVMREEDTARNFSKLYKDLKSDEKLVVVYHAGHLILDTDECFTKFDERSESIDRVRSKNTWRQIFYAQHPEAVGQSSTIFVDSEFYSAKGNLATVSTYIFNEKLANESGKSEFSLNHDALEKLDGSYLGYIRSGSAFDLTTKSFNRSSNSKVADQYDSIIYMKGESEDDFYKFQPPAYYDDVCRPLRTADADPWGCIAERCEGDGTP